MPNHIPLNQLGAGETSPGSSSPFAVPSHHRYTTRLMQELSPEYFSTDEEPKSEEEDMADDGEESEMEGWETQVAQPKSVEEMVEDIRRKARHKRTGVLLPAALIEQRRKSPPTCK